MDLCLPQRPVRNSWRTDRKTHLMALVKSLPRSASTMSSKGMPTKAYSTVAAMPVTVLGAMLP